MTVFATQANIQTTGASVLPIGANGSGKSKLMTAAEIRSAASVYSQAQADAAFVALAGSYTNPSWIVSIPNTKVTGLGTLSTQSGTFSGISSGTNTGDQDLSSYLTSATAATTYVPLTRTLNTLALSADQTFAVGTTGTDFAIVSSGTAHTFNIPDASDTARGLISTGYQIIAGNKDFIGSISATNLSGNNSGDQNLSDYLTIYDAALEYVSQYTLSGITLNGVSISQSQTFSATNDGDDFTIETIGSTHTFKMPDATGTNRGLINTGSQTFAGEKTFGATLTASNLSGNNTGDQTITLTGGVTGSGTGSFAATVVTNANLTGDVTSVGNAATIANDAVTYAKMQNVSATDRILGRSTSGAGNVEEITCTSAARSILDDATVSDMVNTLGGNTSTGTTGLVRASSPTLTTPTMQSGQYIEAGTSFVSNYAAPAQVRMRRAQGTQAAPTQTVAGANLGLFGGMGYKDTGGWSSSWSGYVQFTAAEAITATTSGGYFTFWTTPTLSTTEVMRVWCGAAGNFGIGVFAAEPTTKLTINGDALRIMTAKTPASSAAAGNAGELCWDTTYLYGCTAANTWKRIAWTTF